MTTVIRSGVRPAKILYAVRLERADLLALKRAAKESKVTPSELVRQAIRQIVRVAA